MAVNGALFPDSVDIHRPAPTKSGTGVVTSNPQLLTAGVPARVVVRSGSYRQRERGRKEESTHVGFLRAGVDIKPGDEIHHGAIVYRVTFVARHRNHHVEADLALA